MIAIMPTAKATQPSETASPSIRVLIVDNDEHHALAMAESLDRVGYDCSVASSGPEGARLIEQETFEVVVTDLMMNEVDGLAILGCAKQFLPNCEVVLVTGHGTVPRAVEAMQQGAFNFLEKPLNSDRLRAVTDKAADAVRLKRTNDELIQRLDERFGFEGIIFASPKMKAVIDRLKRIAPTDASVLIQGDTGTGKELVAQAIHQNSPRKKKPYVPLNCGALGEHILESELFGHVRGAFTDASSDHVGKFEYAHGGTLFLDEVGDMPLATQMKLLRVLESGEITRVGENKPIRVNVRLVSATNRDLEHAIEQGGFRRDLYHRLKVVTIDLPRLADRREDIVPLIEHFRKQLVKRHHKTVRSISGIVSRKLFAFDWPGNVRQLRNVVESMVVVDCDGKLDVDDLPAELVDAEQAAGKATGEGLDDLVGRPLAEIERLCIEETLKLTNQNREEAARMLKIGPRTLYRKIKEYGLRESQREKEVK